MIPVRIFGRPFDAELVGERIDDDGRIWLTLVLSPGGDPVETLATPALLADLVETVETF